MTEDKRDIDGSMARNLIDVIERQFKGVDRPVTAEEFSRLYGVIAAQHEATIACYAVAMKANPKLIFTDEAVSAQRAITSTAEALRAALSDLAIASMSDEDRAIALAERENDD